MSTQDEKAVADVLDGAEQQIMVLFRKNAQDLREAVNNYNELAQTSAAKESANTALLTKLRGEIDVALTAHTPIATALNNGEQVSPVAVEEAVAATEVAKQSELEWKAKVNRTLDDHEERITNLEGKDKVPTLAPVPVAEPTPEPKIVTAEPKKSEEKASAVAVVEQKLDDRPATEVRYVNLNPKTWGGLAWALAAAGFIVGGIIVLNIWGGFFPGVPDAIQWVRWLTLLLIPVFGLFAGGALGSYIESQQQPARETTVA